MKTVFCDWGTTNLRAYLLEDGRVVQTYVASTGLRDSQRLGFSNVMQDVLDQFRVPGDTPIRLSGMVGSKHGWKEAPYASTPVDAQTLVSQSVSVDEFPNLRIVSGVCHRMDDGRYDVMRGEEVQVFGLLVKYPNADTICLPGTHSKWVNVQNQAIQNFSTWMTGDFFQCLSEHSIFQEQISNKTFDEQAFLRGIAIAETSDQMLSSIFHLRTDYLFGKIVSDQFHSYLSGFLIGQEVKSAAQNRTHVYLCGSDIMMKYYENTFSHFGIQSTSFPAEEATLLGMQLLNEESRDA